MPSVSIIGVGRLGGALAIAVSRVGYRVERLVHRRRDTAERVSQIIEEKVELAEIDDVERLTSDVIIIACPDPTIPDVAADIRSKVGGGQIVIHTSGSISSEILAPLRDSGAAVGSMHPLASISDPVEGALRFAGTYFCVEGDVEAVDTGQKIAGALGAFPFTIDPETKPLYHASAVMAAGHAVALFDAACEVLSACGVDARMANTILFPLLRSSVENLRTQPPENALTGTYARSDLSTADKHLTFLSERVRPDTAEIYIDLALRSVELALRAGGNGPSLEAIRDRILMAKGNP